MRGAAQIRRMARNLLIQDENLILQCEANGTKIACNRRSDISPHTGKGSGSKD